MELISFAILLIIGIIGASMAGKRNRSTFGGFLLGLLLGLIGLAIIAIAGNKEN